MDYNSTLDFSGSWGGFSERQKALSPWHVAQKVLPEESSEILVCG